MNIKKKNMDLSDREQVVMTALWNSDHALTNNEIAEISEKSGTYMSAPSVSQVTKKLLDRGMIEVPGSILSGTVYARTFRPVISKEMYLESEFNRLQGLFSSNRFLGALGAFQMLLGRDSYKTLSKAEKEEIRKALKEAERELEEE